MILKDFSSLAVFSGSLAMEVNGASNSSGDRNTMDFPLNEMDFVTRERLLFLFIQESKKHMLLKPKNYY